MLPAVLTVQKNAEYIDVGYKTGGKELMELKEILDSVQSMECVDCWVLGSTDSHGKHRRPPVIARHLRILGKSTVGETIHWPVCWYCWVPFRHPCNHVSVAGKALGAEHCPFPVALRIIPTLVLLVLNGDAEQVTSLANDLGVDRATLEDFPLLERWLMIAPTAASEIWNAHRVLLAFHRARRLQNVPEQMQID